MTDQIETGAVELTVRGPFDLGEVAMMGFGHRDERRFDGVMRLAFCLDDSYETPVGVELRQEGQTLRGRVVSTAGAAPDLDRVTAQVARVVSADHDGERYAEICRADPVLAPVWGVAPGFRPALFYSPYEAAVWSVLSARRGRAQGIRVRERLAAEHGTIFELAGQQAGCIPGASRLCEIEAVQSLPPDRIPRLHAIGSAARDGQFAVDRLQAMEPDAAMTDLQQLPGIGPFYSSLIVIRALGLADVLPDEGHVREETDRRYGRTLSLAEFIEVAQGWRPFRTWVAVMLRALGERAPVAG